MTIQVAIVGFGLSGRTFHAPLIQAAGMRVSAVVTSRPDDARQALPGIQVFAELDTLLRSNVCALVVVATPNQLHVQQATAALRAGHHVVIDKPAALTATQIDDLIGVAEEQGRKVAVFHNRRWDGDFMTLERLIATRQLGELSAFHMRWDRFRPTVPVRWREDEKSGGGVLLDLGPHMVDQALRLLGQPDWVQAAIFSQRAGASVDDAFEILMANGSLAISLGVSSLAAAPGARYIVHGTRGSYVKAGIDVQEQQLRDGLDPLTAAFGTEPPAGHGKLFTAGGGVEVVPTERGRWTQFYTLLRASLEGEGPIPVALSEARSVAAVIDAARVSSREGRRVHLNPMTA